MVVLFGLISLTGSSNGLYSPYESVAVFSIFVILTATFLAWLNSKLLYKFELERYAMREELKAHNIELKFDNETLTGEMSDLKKENKDYLGKLNTVDQYRKIIEDTE